MDYLKILEFNKILEQLAKHAISECAKDLCRSLTPFTDFDEAAASLKETDEAYVLYSRFGAPSFMDMQDISYSAERAKNGATLSIAELLDIAHLLTTVRNLKLYLDNHTTESDSLNKYIFTLTPNREIEIRLNDAFSSSEEVSDNASPKLHEIRRKQGNAKNKIRQVLDTFLKSAAYKNCLQDGIVTIRNDRYVLPVKAECKGEIKGLVHDTSASGATLFIEPMAVVSANNELAVLASEERHEIERILSAFSAEIGGIADSLSESCKTAIFFDFTFAKAKYAIEIKASSPVLNQNGYVNLKKARHPLIDKDVVVPIDITLGKAYTSLIITGPNTGGKTVSIKTAGLLCLMSKSGLFIPAADNSEVAFFDNIYADIGDEQSIEQSLSTFSAHMSNIIDIISKITEDSLVLIDELGSGTDPAEGAALAMAIIEYIQNFGTRLICTTHYAELKVFAVSNPHAENASCEFDVTTLKPTYRLITGLPGKSNAFAIASRLGLSDDIIDIAKEKLSNETVKMDSILADIEISRKQIEFDAREAAQMRKEAQTVLSGQEQAAAEIKRQAEEIINKAKEQAAKIVNESEKEGKRLISELETIKRQKDREKLDEKLAEAKTELKEMTSKAASELKIEKPKAAKPKRPIVKGDTIRIVSLDKEGTVIEPPDAKGNLTVQAGIIKTKLKLSDVELIEKQFIKSDFTGASSIKAERGSRAASLELDVRGLTAYEAEIEVDDFINNCYMSGLKNITIIHGKGSGALRSAIKAHLKQHKLVDEFRLGVYGEGETGVTIVTLK